MTNANTFEGNLAEAPQLAYTTKTATPVADFVVLVNRRVRDKAGEWSDAQPTRHRVKAYRALGEHVAELERGCTVLVHGYVETETWTDTQTGDKRTADIVTAEAIGASLRFTTVTIAKTSSTPSAAR